MKKTKLIFLAVASAIITAFLSYATINYVYAEDYGPLTAFNFRIAKTSGGVRVTTYGLTPLTLATGEGVRIRLAAAVNQNTDLTYYSNYGRDGTFGWVQVPGFDRAGDNPLGFTVPNGKSLTYVANSTLYQECD